MLLLLCALQIISPTKKGLLGTFELNLALQPLMNPNCSPPTPPSFTQQYRATTTTTSSTTTTLEEDSETDDSSSSSSSSISSFPWKVGDRVMHTKNDVELDVYNGDLGYIIRADPERRTLEVQYPAKPGSGGRGHVVKYEKKALLQLQLAWASTVHKVGGGKGGKGRTRQGRGERTGEEKRRGRGEEGRRGDGGEGGKDRGDGAGGGKGRGGEVGMEMICGGRPREEGEGVERR